MRSIFENGHAEKAPPTTDKRECWYLPIFGIYHPQKPNQLRVVFDSSAKYGGVSLNDILLTGPDLTNSLSGILLRFRGEPVAIMGDIQQMFYCFKVDENNRDFLRFLWYEDNDFNKSLTDYHMCVHVFGNSPSPAIATYGLRKTAEMSKENYGDDVYNFICRDFYVDDGITSLPTPGVAIDLMKRTQSALQTIGNLRLHKIASNSEEVMKAFQPFDLTKDLKDLDLSSDTLPVQRSLGLNWDIETDSFMFKLAKDIKPYTRRGILSTINSVYDPLGFLAPVLIQGKLIQRELTTGNVDWNETLPQSKYEEWETWKTSLHHLEKVTIQRMCLSRSFSDTVDKKLHIFSDAPEKAIAAVAYFTSVRHSSIGFVLGKAKVAPTHGHSIPRLEPCAAVLATEIGQTISDNLDIPFNSIQYHTDSMVVLGYISNEKRRFYTYVSNRVAKIRQLSQPEQWTYVPTDKNPTDLATRAIPAADLQQSSWLLGPKQLLGKESILESFELQNPEEDKENRPEIVCAKSIASKESLLGTHRFESFSFWKRLVNAITYIKRILGARANLPKIDYLQIEKEAENSIIKEAQKDMSLKNSHASV
ncbi:uncharacterized protein LOC125669103 [Ostrea edulis]|uniref:uncharacterized protein LOC125669103 n=1 Tax=Ostrea edulis TaxID=37623 RepID=UPI0024AEA6B5|nr:uncharacterized protein LOC125669103 [Ostrea edulis]